MSVSELEKMMRELEEEMLAAAEELRFEYAAKLRDEIRDLRREFDAATAAGRIASGCCGPRMRPRCSARTSRSTRSR